MNKDAAISFRLDEKTLAEIDRLADLEGTARTAIVREAIAKHLKVQPPKAQLDNSKLNLQLDGYRSRSVGFAQSSNIDAQASRIDAVEAELGELECLISDLYRLSERSIERSSVIEAATQKLVKAFADAPI
ncbi:MAG: CopG family transcriptional regulator [Hydrococcus sp. CSU_1_8]|nr:CopG family transcriptional regulator [Hydrococcus sp. CSU_1_8]